jgi:hypothetical protein
MAKPDPMSISPKPGIDWFNVAWRGPDQVRTKHCSHCGDAFLDDERGRPDFIPLIFFREDGLVAEFCDRCRATWFGVRSFPDPIEPWPEPEARRRDG